MGLLQPLSGKVLINGKRIKNWNKVIQSDMSFVGSNSFILNKSIVDNICLNNSKLEKQEIISLSLKLGFNEITKKNKKKYNCFWLWFKFI